MENIFLQISVLFGITVSISLFIKLLKQPLIIAYIFSGLFVGPLFLNLIDGSEHYFESFAEMGIVLLLFMVGLGLNLEFVKKSGKTVAIGTLTQFAVTGILGFLIMYFLNFAFWPAVFIAVAITFSSTIIVTKLLADKKDLDTTYGRYMIGLLLIQDIIAVMLLIFINTSTSNGGVWYRVLGTTMGKGFVLVGVVYFLAKYILPKVIEKVANSGELLFIFTIAWCFGVASLVYMLGFGLEIGAVIAGISLGTSPYQTQISSRVKPLRDFFIVLFFIVLGSELQLGDIQQAIVPGAILTAFVLIFDPLILFIIMRRLKYTRRNAFLTSITTAQVSEFGFILIFAATGAGFLAGVELAILTIVALSTIIVSSYVITYNEQIYKKILPILKKFGKDVQQEIEVKTEYPVWIFGYHRMGWKICEALKEKGMKFAVVDYDPNTIKKLKQRDIPAFFGDASDVEFLEELPLEKAKLIISTIPEVNDQKTLISHIRQHSKKIYIISTLFHVKYLRELYKEGADYVMLPHLLGGEWIANTLKENKWGKKLFNDLKKEQKEELKLRFTEGTHQ
ncbi:MAG: cation:proton antiporter [Candidatus Magasanikbacteria bacterium]|nr:cation:proton antiporter [Candidatus Magasanikbacteria bacterium]